MGQWSPLGSGMNNAVRGVFYDDVEGVLYAAGDFTEAGDSIVNGIAWWDGTHWHPLGGGVQPGWVAVEDVRKQGGEIVIGGHFGWVDSVPGTPHVASWNGAEWQPCLPSGGATGGNVLGVEFIDSLLYVFGSFANLGTIDCKNVGYRSGGEWHSTLREGLMLPGESDISCVARYQGDLYVGGNFEIAPGLHEIGQVQGDSLVAVGGGIHGDSWLWDMIVYDGRLYASGFFGGSGNAASMIMAWDGTQWINPFPQVVVNAQVRDMTVHDDALYFTGTMHPVGSSMVSYVGKFDGEQICLLGGGNAYVGAIAVGGGYAYCGTLIGGSIPFGDDSVIVRRIAALDLSYPPDTCISVQTSMLEPVAQNAMRLYPNPAEDHVTLAGLEAASGGTVQVVDVLGRMATGPAPITSPTMHIDTRQLLPGSYAVRISGKDGIWTSAFLKR